MIVFYCIVVDFNVLYRIVPNCFVYCALQVHIVLNLIYDSDVLRFAERAHGVVVPHPLRMRKALGSIPSVSICVETQNCSAGRAGTSQQTRPQLRAPKATPRGFCADRVILSSLSTNSADRNSTRVFRVTSANAKQNVIADDVV